MKRLLSPNCGVDFTTFAIAIFLMLCLADSATHPDDIQALKQLKRSIHPNSIRAGSCLSSWDFSSDPCGSLFTARFTCGLRCDLTLSGFSRVTEIALDSAGYTGSLARVTRWSLPYLNTLDLSENSLAGAIPDSLSNLTRLRRLSLSGNFFALRIPSSLGSLSLLEELYLDNNNLIGALPKSFNNLKSLKRLELQQNHLSGNFPSLGSLNSLYFLDLTDNNISGFLPFSFPNSLVSLSIRNNSLNGRIPINNLDQLSYLEVLDLSFNRLIGPVYKQIFIHPSLQQISLSHNGFSSIESPSGTGEGSKLVAIDLSYNKIAGFLPEFLAEMPNLSALSLEYNRFTGMIPSEYAAKATAQTAPFQRLLLGGNYLFGPIPGQLLRLKPGSTHVSLVDNCLYMCLDIFFFCQGGDQKSLSVCKSFGHSSAP